ncbi:hypothetical protein GCG54_00015612 [Colletotrichum gloeosporioides]|uniref:Uncharacterized protein n=1 Tax=Colletotrichum gloeosporioides TaxID=474922 RepID=A0A8H4FGE4_COLGL|nr:uncharacterized protein GCG54_00015612 [Colletotrichum gloeosporioides]KAF3800029.1 hypothetical protein GCG54_00015612 [Colletotrichum gloeosporioides]
MAEAKANKKAAAATKASRGKKMAVQAQQTKKTARRPDANDSEPQDDESILTRSAAQANTNAEQTRPTREKASRHGTHMTDTRGEVEHGRKTRSASHAEQVQVRQPMLSNVATEADNRMKHVASGSTPVDELAELTELERKHDICARSMQSLDLFHRERVERIRRFISVVQRDKHLSPTRYEDPLSLREEPAAVTVQRDLEEARYSDALGMIKEYAEEVLDDYKSTAWADTANEHFQELRRTRERLKALSRQGSE